MGFDTTLERQAENRAHCNGETHVGTDVGSIPRLYLINL